MNYSHLIKIRLGNKTKIRGKKVVKLKVKNNVKNKVNFKGKYRNSKGNNFVNFPDHPKNQNKL